MLSVFFCHTEAQEVFFTWLPAVLIAHVYQFDPAFQFSRKHSSTRQFLQGSNPNKLMLMNDPLFGKTICLHQNKHKL